MSELSDVIMKCFNVNIYKSVMSAPIAGDSLYKKAIVRKYGDKYQIEKLTATQAFHENTDFEGAVRFMINAAGEQFRQINMWDGEHEYSLRISKKGKVLLSRQDSAVSAPANELRHNRDKKYLLTQGAAIGPLVDMGILTADGRVVKSMNDKFKQINRFLEILDNEVKKLDIQKPLRIIDFGCGKSYLTFVMYHYFTEIKGLSVKMTGLDLKADVVEKCAASALRYGYKDLEFKTGDIESYNPGEETDIVVALHACDTATDYALFSAVKRNAGLIFCVPCCQHELNSQIHTDRLSGFTRYGIVKERISALLTDTIRANLLDHCGYKTQMLEFVDFEHTPKNIMLRAVKRDGTGSGKALSEAEALILEFNLNPTLYRLLKENGRI